MLLYGLVLSPTNAQKVSGFRVVVLKGPSEVMNTRGTFTRRHWRWIAMLHSLGAPVSATSRNFSRVSVSAVSACLLLTGAMFVLQECGAISRARLHSRNKSNKWLGAQIQIQMYIKIQMHSQILYPVPNLKSPLLNC